MIEIKEITVSDKLGLNSLYIEFRIKDTPENLDNYIFDLYKANHQTAPFSVIATDIKDFTYIDLTVNLYNVTLNYYYKVKITDKTTGEYILSDIYGEYKGANPDLEAQAILDIHKIYVDNIIKNKMILLKMKHFGQVCTCFDDVRRRSNPSNCTLCYGTKYTGGYYDPYIIPVNYANAASKHEKFTPSDVGEEDSPVQLWTNNYPLIQMNDILIDRNSVRYIVTNYQPTHKNFYLIRQILQIQRLPRSNVIYQLNVNAQI